MLDFIETISFELCLKCHFVGYVVVVIVVKLPLMPENGPHKR